MNQQKQVVSGSSNPCIGVNTARNRRRRMKRREKRAQKGLPRNPPRKRGGNISVAPRAMTTVMEDVYPGETTNVLERNFSVNRNPQGKQRNRLAVLGTVRPKPGAWPNSTLSPEAEGFIVKHLDPNGEYNTEMECCHVPDGALPQSAIIALRDQFAIKSPLNTTSTISLSGDTWTLLLWAMPTFRYPLVMIATMSDSEPSSADMEIFTIAFNNFPFNVETGAGFYPNWVAVVGSALFFAVREWEALTSVAPPTATGFSSLLSQYRITSDGITIFNNTPTLVDQGMIIGTQFNANFQNVAASVVVDDTGDFSAVIAISWTFVNGASLVWNWTTPGLLLPNQTGAASGSTATGTFVTPNQFTVVATGTTITQGSTITWSQLSSGNLQFSTVAAGIFLTVQTGPSYPTTTMQFAYFPITVTLAGEEDITLAQSINKVQTPAHDVQNMVQAVPRTVTLTMKEDNGGYMVKRVFEPVFNMTQASDFAPIRFNSPGTTLGDLNGAVGTLSDSFDRNYSMGVFMLQGIPTSCLPFIKMNRTVEVVATPNSPWMVFMQKCPPKDAIYDQVIRSFIEQHPLMYPESYNVFDKLFGMVTSMLSELPIVNATVPAIANIVKGAIDAFSGGGGKKRGLTVPLEGGL